VGGSNDNYHHISATNAEIRCFYAITLSRHMHKAVRQEMFDVCFTMFDVSMRNSK
jgi:hypothetical protein